MVMIWLNSSTLLEHKITHLPSSEKQKQPSTCLQTTIDQKIRWLISTKSHPPGHPSSTTRKPGTRRQLSQKSTRCRATINKIRPQLMFIRIPVSLVLTLPSINHPRLQEGCQDKINLDWSHTFVEFENVLQRALSRTRLSSDGPSLTR